MTLNVQHLGSVDVVRLPDRLMLANAPELRADLLRQVDQGARSLILDLSDVEFADSSGLSAVLAGVTAARRAGGDVVLTAPTARVRALIELTRLDEAIRVFPNVRDGVAHLSDQAA
jgi:anti-anti-sigma factor